MKEGDKVEVLVIWAQGVDASWFGGYEYVRQRDDKTAVVRHTSGYLEGCEVNYPNEAVRGCNDQA